MQEEKACTDGQEILTALELSSAADAAVAAEAVAPAATAAVASGAALALPGGLSPQPLQQHAPPPLLCSRTSTGRRIVWTQELHAAFLAATEAAGASPESRPREGGQGFHRAGFRSAPVVPASSWPRLSGQRDASALRGAPRAEGSPTSPTLLPPQHTHCPDSAGGVHSAKARDILARMGVEGLTLQ